MKKNMQRTLDDFLDLINFVEEGFITIEEFRAIEKIDKAHIIKQITNILKKDDIVGKDILVKQLLSHLNELEQISFLLNEIPIYKTDIEKRNFILENTNFERAFALAPLIKYDFIFNDKELLEKIMIGEVTNNRVFEMSVVGIPALINNNLDLFIGGERNNDISMAFDMKTIINISSFFKLTFICREEIKKDKWVGYFYDLFKSEETYDLGNILRAFKYLIKNKRMDDVNKKIDDIDKMEIEYEEKLEIFKYLLVNLDTTSIESMEDDNKFEYLLNFMLIDPDTYFQHNYFVNLFVDESYCKRGSDTYNEIFKIEDYNIRNRILKAFSYSLGKYITLDFIRKCHNLNLEHLDQVILELEKIAVDNNVLDYLEHETRGLLSKRLPVVFNDYIDANIDMTKEELLKIKDLVVNSSYKIEDGCAVLDINMESVIKTKQKVIQ